ncbi:MAG: GH25 family lysozyme, partial [Eubacterium sp.]
MKKIISLILSVVMLLCVTVGSVFPAFAGQPIFGYDVSHNNDLVNFTDAKKDGKDFVMIRLGYYNHLDNNFWANVENACKANMDFGVYLYSYAYTVEEAQIEANFVLDTISQMGDYEEFFTLPVAYDLEEDKILQNCTASMINKQMTVFCDTIKNAGYTPMVNANKNWLTNYLDASLIKSKGYKFWYSYWQSNPDFSAPIKAGNTDLTVDMWQYLGGSNGSLDENVIFNPDSIVKERGCVHKIKTTVTKATASKDGKAVKSCSKCNLIISSSSIPKASSIKLSTTSYTYDGKVKKPTVK